VAPSMTTVNTYLVYNDLRWEFLGLNELHGFFWASHLKHSNRIDEI
jgi:hypothetical protein